jgi:aspartyl/asparaginyl beta-hydroxylase (cupin superfamily)
VPSIQELRERADTLRSEALRLLDLGVLAALRAGLDEVTVAGSVALDLMVWRDIDLYVRLDSAEASRLLRVVPVVTDALASAGRPVSRVAYRDEHIEPDPAFPDAPGLYLGLVTADGWKLDVWGWDAAQYPLQQQRHAELAADLRRADRDVILRLKDACWDKPGYRSTDVYAFALNGAGDSLEDFRRYQERLGR